MVSLLVTTWGLLLAMIFSGIAIGAGMGIAAMIIATIFSPRRLDLALGFQTWTHSTSFTFAAVPLFVLMAEILMRARITERIFYGVSPWVQWLPGGLLHTNIASTALFGAICGSSSATTVTVATVALPELDKRGYNERLVLGTLAAGGTLAGLIPPSLNMILYGALSDTSVGRLFLAGFIPGILSALLYMVVIVVVAKRWPHVAPKEAGVSIRDMLSRARFFIPFSILFLLMLGSIYMGFATPTEAAALGVLGALVLAIAYRTVSIRSLVDAFQSTSRTTGMVFFLFIMAMFFAFVIGILKIPEFLVNWMALLDVPNWTILAIILVLYLVLGMIMSVFEMLVVTIPIVFPIIVAAGYDPVWFGIVTIVMCEVASITPPVGMVLYVLQGIRLDPRKSIMDVFYGYLPFSVADATMITLLVLFPSIALWLPNTMK